MRKSFLAVIYCILLRAILILIVGVKYINRKALKKHKQFIIVSNHNSHVDTAALLSSLPMSRLTSTHPVAAGDYFGKSPKMAFFTKLFVNAILIQRKHTEDGPNPIELMNTVLEKGESLILFPEGSRGEPQKMQQFKKGIGIILSLHPHIPYIPVYMTAMGRILPKGEKLLVPFDSYVIFGEPAFCKSTDVDEIVKEVEHAVLELSKLSPLAHD